MTVGMGNDDKQRKRGVIRLGPMEKGMLKEQKE
jgi:hypothetical protein